MLLILKQNIQQQNKKKALFFLPGGVGGAERMTITIVSMLPKEEYEVKFVVVGRKLNDLYYSHTLACS